MLPRCFHIAYLFKHTGILRLLLRKLPQFLEGAFGIAALREQVRQRQIRQRTEGLLEKAVA